MHLSDPAEQAAALGWYQRLSDSYGDVTLLLTGAPGGQNPQGICTADLPGETSGEVTAFLAHWRPNFAVWSGNHLHPRLIWQHRDTCGPIALIHAANAPFTAPRAFWGNLAQAVLPLFSDIFALDGLAHARLTGQLGAEARVHPGGRLQPSMAPLPVQTSDLERRAAELSGRPVWLATAVVPTELQAVLRAHRRVSRMAHRLLLLLVPDSATPADQALSAATDIGLRAKLWGDVALSDDALQVVIAPDPVPLGLLYRLAPVCFLGGSLTAQSDGTDPYQAAALGSAILYGPHVSAHSEAYRDLSQASAARLVRDADGLARVLTAVLAADVAAQMAHAGWEVLSAGAPLSDALLGLAQTALDQAEAA